MAIIQFGKTWWGQQWLNSLANIDYSNRLPRGATYARNGSVLSIKVEENIIRAKVQGSQRKPYDVTIIIPPFFEADIRKLVEAISLKPVIISKLLNRELDPELLSIAEQCGLKMFPRQWTDFKMQCSCPDWAVPCKHLASVIYKISAEIDNNPFLVFQLHRVDLPKELAAVHIHINQANSEVPLLSEVLRQASSKSSGQKSEASTQLSFAVIPAILEALVQLLPDAPVFYPHAANFREKYEVSLRRVAKGAHRVLQCNMPLVFVSAMKKGSPSFLFSHHDTCRLVVNGDYQYTIDVQGIETPLTPAQFITALWQIPAAHEGDFQPVVASYRNHLLLALNLLGRGAVVPQIVRLGNGKFHVRWLPAMLSKEVRKILENISGDNTVPLVYLDVAEASKTRKKTKKTAGERELEVIHTDSLQLCSFFLTELVAYFNESRGDDNYLALFFDGRSNAFSAPGEDAVAGGIQQWLQRFYLTGERFKPSIVVTEVGSDFKIGIEMQEVAKPMEKPVSVDKIFTQKQYEKTRFDILQSLSRMSAFIPGLDAYINQQGRRDLVLDLASFTPFLMQAIPAIELLDISILLPKSLQNVLRPRSSVRIRQKSESTGMLRLDKLLDFDWQVAIGETVMDEQEFRKLMKSADGLIKYKSNYIYVDNADLEKLYKHFQSSKNLSAHEMLRVALAGDYHGAAISITDEVQRLIVRLTSQEAIELPRQLNARLRPYQHRGYSWMYRNAQVGFGSVLADDMGLGKTLQVITTLQRLKEDGALQKEKAIVVAPTGLLTNWQAEVEKFAPSLRSTIYHGTNRTFDAGDTFDVLITTYGIVRSDVEILKKKKWFVVVIDEAQNVKNHTTEQSKAVKSLKASTFIAMSGTPVENRLSELWSIMDFSNRGFLGTLADFKESFADPIQNERDVDAAGRLKRVTAPFLMRRMKNDKTIISDLPDKIEMDRYCQLVPGQASLYEKTLQEAMSLIEGTGTDKKSLFVRQGLVLQMILALKQICNHPSHFLKNKAHDPAMSGKVQLLFDTLEPIVESNEKVLIFTQFTEMGEMLKTFIAERFGDEPLFYHGGCSVAQRNEMVAAFQANRVDKIFILSLKAAGTGLNLTAANHVIHYDLWWNPAVEAQATDRAYRIGQKSNVMVHRFITRNTFEESINTLIQSKKDLADMTVATGENWIGNLSNKEIRDLFSLGNKDI